MTRAPSDGNAASASAAAAWVIITAGLMAFLYLMRPILLPFELGIIVAYVCTPLIDALAARAHGYRWIFALLVLLLLMAVIATVGYLGLPTAGQQLSDLVGNPRQVIAGFVRVLVGNRTFNLAGASINATQIAAHVAAGLASLATDSNKMLGVALAGMAGLFELVLTWVIIGYLLFDAPRVFQGLLWLIAPRRRPIVLQFWRRLDPILRRYFIGIVLVVLYASVAAYIGLGLFLGIHHALFLALMTGLLELVPLFGPVASAVLVGLVAVRQAVTAANILAFIVYAIALRLSIDQFFGPLVLGRAAHIRPVMVIFCFLAGGILLGIPGIILAVPVALSIKVALTMRKEGATAQRDGERGVSV